jgi:tRNA G37 N-methylase Trm5
MIALWESNDELSWLLLSSIDLNPSALEVARRDLKINVEQEIAIFVIESRVLCPRCSVKMLSISSRDGIPDL